MNVTAKSKKEAAKLAGLVLAHKGVIKHLADNGYIVGVIDRDNPNENVEKFSVWKTPEKNLCGIHLHKISKYKL